LIKEKILQEVEKELSQGTTFLSSIDHHWVGLSLAELATQPVSYLQAWL